MRFEAFVAQRYLRSKRQNRFVSLITVISIAGVAVGIITLIVVMGIMTGFDNALQATIIGNRSHLTIQDISGDPFNDPDSVIAALHDIAPEIEACGPVIQTEALIVNKTGRRDPTANGAMIVGVDPERETKVTMLAENLSKEAGREFGYGDLPGDKEIVLGYILARQLGVTVGDMVELMTYRETPKPTPLGGRSDKGLWVRVSGLSQAKMSEFDQLYGFVNINTALMLTGKKGAGAIHCKLNDPMVAARVGDRIEMETGLFTVTWYENQQAYFEALKQEKIAMFIVLVFIVMVAAFNITSTLIMVVMEKRRDIGILKTVGTNTATILRLFVLQGLFIGLAGTITGVVCGTLLAYYINPIAEFIAGLFGVSIFDSTIYYFDRIPVDIVPSDVVLITIAAVALSFLSTLYPAWSAARLDPVDALRHE